MKRLFFYLLFTSCIFKSNCQSIADSVPNELKRYFITLPTDKGFQKWIENIINDSTIVIDTSISRKTKDSFYVYLRFDSKSMPIVFGEIQRRMVVLARNNLKSYSKEKIYLLIQMEYAFDSTIDSKAKVKGLYKKINAQIKRNFKRNIEHSSNKKNREYGINNFYSEYSFTPFTVIHWGKFKDHSYGLTISLNYELTKE